MWAVITLLFMYAFLLGVAAPLTPRTPLKRVSSGVCSVQFGVSLVTARATLQPPASRRKVSVPGEYWQREKEYPRRDRNDIDVVMHRFFFSAVRRLRYLHCLPFSQYIMLGILSVRNDPHAEV